MSIGPQLNIPLSPQQKKGLSYIKSCLTPPTINKIRIYMGYKRWDQADQLVDNISKKGFCYVDGPLVFPIN